MLAFIVLTAAGATGFLSSLMMTAGPWKYVTSGGDPGNVTSAKNTILYGFMGGILAALPAGVVLLLSFPATSLGKVLAALAFSPFPVLILNALTMASFVTVVHARSRAVQQIVRSVAIAAAMPLPKEERADFVERTRAMLTHCQPRDRWALMFNTIAASPKMAAERHRSRVRATSPVWTEMRR